MPPKAPLGLVLSAPGSNSGKTLITLALLRALKNQGIAVAGAKSGPDYIDPRFHEAACGQNSYNLDGFAMSQQGLQHWAATATSAADLLLVEGAMGLFDGAVNGQGSTADIADSLGLPIVLIIDCKGVGQSAAAIAKGFADFRQSTRIAGVILNRVNSQRHFEILQNGFQDTNISVLGHVRTSPNLAIPARHLGLIQAEEHAELSTFLDTAADIVTNHIDLEALIDAAAPLQTQQAQQPASQPLAQYIAIARDEAFAFCYPHQLTNWQSAGASLSFFSPLNDEAPALYSDAVFLPGGYPELHASALAHAENFREGMNAAKERNAVIYGECGGYMVLGDWLICNEKRSHKMLGLLPLETSFAERKLHLGYRKLKPLQTAPFTSTLIGHEFHYASTMRTGAADALFDAEDASGAAIGPIGLRRNTVMGSFAHVI
ncbi:UNVERIFIED_CONTAM: hypothetical protein GTU68_034318 [Idotea baltica]|nr:hypothetical protein [Idotea baltica]